MPTAGVVSVIDNNVYTEAVSFGGAYGWGVESYAVWCIVTFLLQSRDTCLLEQYHDAIQRHRQLDLVFRSTLDIL